MYFFLHSTMTQQYEHETYVWVKDGNYWFILCSPEIANIVHVNAKSQQCKKMNRVKIYKQRAFFPSKCNQLAQKLLPIVCVTYLTWIHEWIKWVSWGKHERGMGTGNIEWLWSITIGLVWKLLIFAQSCSLLLRVAHFCIKLLTFLNFNLFNQILHICMTSKEWSPLEPYSTVQSEKKCNAKKFYTTYKLAFIVFHVHFSFSLSIICCSPPRHQAIKIRKELKWRERKSCNMPFNVWTFLISTL